MHPKDHPIRLFFVHKKDLKEMRGSLYTPGFQDNTIKEDCLVNYETVLKQIVIKEKEA